jgi:hypothetical protein
VAPVATILGLLLVVTFIANYLTTTLPSQMSVNDVNHEVQVENQVGQLQALLDSVADSGRVGAPVSQPISLGSAGSPPFAGPDSGWISPGNLSGGFNVNFTVGAAPTFVTPSQDGAAGKGACTGPTPTRCPAGTWFTAAVSPSVANDLLVLAITVYEQGATLTTADVSDGAGSTWNLVNTGGNAVSGGTCRATNFCQYIFWAVDSSIGSDTVTIGATGLSAHDASAILFALESVNTASPISASGAFATATSTTASATVAAPASGLVLGLVSSASGGTSTTFPTITAGAAGTPCTATCTLIASEDGESWGVTFGESEPATTAGTYTASATLSTAYAWGERALAISPAVITPPGGTSITSGGSPPGASLVVHLSNTYAPAAEVAFDQGAVVYAQPGGVPLMIDAPSFSYSTSSVSLTIPVFQGTIPSESGTGTADVMLRLLSTNTYQFPVTGFALQHHVTLSLRTPYWAAWMTYFASTHSLAGLVSCTNLAGTTPCPSPTSASYQPGQSLATITLSLPATSLTLGVAVFAVSVT